MASPKMMPVEQVLEHINLERNFVLQGGAGSGKTEALKQVVQSITQDEKAKKIACITHTNKAADEIAERITGSQSISTIHSFFGGLIRPYKANIKKVLPEIFVLPHFERLGEDEAGDSDKEKKKTEHDRFKKSHGKLETRRLTVFDEKTEKVTGKREYDKTPDIYVAKHNKLIESLNKEIRKILTTVDADKIIYNETPFDNFGDPSYGHDGLIQIACFLFDKYPMLGKVLSDRYDCVFIDEFQDTSPEVIRVLIETSLSTGLTLGLFGDSEQAIYEDGIGDVQHYIGSKKINLVEKMDNYRCSSQVIKVANKFRCDGLKQEVALKTLSNGILETIESRQGSAKLYLALAPTKEDTGNKTEDNRLHKEACEKTRDQLVAVVEAKYPTFTQLKLTNKSIARNVGFGGLWDIFDARFRDTRDRMTKTLNRLQFGQLYDVIELFNALPGDRRAYNKLIAINKKAGFAINTVADKANLEEKLRCLTNENLSAYEAIEFALKNKIISISDSHRAFIHNRDASLADFHDDKSLAEFKLLVDNGHNTKVRMKKELGERSGKLLTVQKVEDEFEEYEYKLKKWDFLSRIFSKDLKNSEILAYYSYEKDEGNFATMHKTKGTGIEDVIVVCDEYGWSQEYDFSSCFSAESPETAKEVRSRKLLYVACSRTKKNLVCIRLASDPAEVERLKAIFSNIELIKISPGG